MYLVSFCSHFLNLEKGSFERNVLCIPAELSPLVTRAMSFRDATVYSVWILLNIMCGWVSMLTPILVDVKGLISMEATSCWWVGLGHKAFGCKGPVQFAGPPHEQPGSSMYDKRDLGSSLPSSWVSPIPYIALYGVQGFLKLVLAH